MKWRRAIKVLGVSALLAAGVVIFCPKPSLYGDVGYSAAVLDRNGELLRLTLAPDDRYRLRVPIDEIARSAIDATLLYEDRYFYQHPGFNPVALLRASWSTWVTRDRTMGASTITMQLARIRFGLNTRSIGGKLAQIGRAVQLERHYSKREILEAYLNLAPYGGNVEGIGTAALIYFDKPAANLSLPEALALAVVPQNPVERNPAASASRKEWFEARKRLLRQWHTSNETAQQFDLPLAVRRPQDLPFLAPHFVQSATSADSAGALVTTLDLPKQKTLERLVSDYVARRAAAGINNASAMLIDTRSMQVLASVGSADFHDDRIEGQVDGTRAKRSPGSTLKPFVYGMAIDDGLIHPMSLMRDAPRRFAAYTPENFDRGFLGPVVARDALVYSRNVPAIELLTAVGHERFHGFLETGKVRNLADADFYGLAMVLGGIELTMEEVVSLYAMLVNGGVLRPLTRTMDATSPGGERLLSAEASFLVLDMLRDNPHSANTTPRSVAWKTGTSWAYRDAWTVGVFGSYALAIWVGNFDGSGNPAFVGRQAAAPLFFLIVDALAADEPGEFRRPEPRPGLNLRKVDVCAGTGDLPGRHCPGVTVSWFVPGVSPIRVSDVHRVVHVDKQTGLRACNASGAETRQEVFEFWPSDIAILFEKAGIAKRRPPRWSPECSLDVLATTGRPPEIRSLSEKLSYQLRPGSEDLLPLTASTDADVTWLYWFVDDSFVGKSARDEALLWRPVEGVHDVLAVDDVGRSDSMQLTVAVAQ